MDSEQLRAKATSLVVKTAEGTFLEKYSQVLDKWTPLDLAMITGIQEAILINYSIATGISIGDEGQIYLIHGYGDDIVLEPQPLRVNGYEIDDLVEAVDSVFKDCLLCYYRGKVTSLIVKQGLEDYIQEFKEDRVILFNDPRQISLEFLKHNLVRVDREKDERGNYDCVTSYMEIKDQVEQPSLLPHLEWLAEE